MSDNQEPENTQEDPILEEDVQAKLPQPEEELDFEADEGELKKEDGEEEEVVEEEEEGQVDKEDGEKEDGEEDEDGELNSDEDLEEGEVKEDSDEDPKEIRGQITQKSLCKFFHKGPPGNKTSGNHGGRSFTGSIPPQVMAGPTGLRSARVQSDFEFFDHPPAPPPPHRALPPLRLPPAPLPPPPSVGPSESAWERGLRNAKEMMVKASRRKEEEVDFDDKRFNLGIEEGRSSRRRRESGCGGGSPGGGRQRSPHQGYHRRSHRDHRERESDKYREKEYREREPRSHRDRDRERDRGKDYWNSEYERKRRLAFEYAPINRNESSHRHDPYHSRSRGGQGSAEEYRDPWMRSTDHGNRSPPGSRSRNNNNSFMGGSGGNRRPESRPVDDPLKRSNSMSSISDSDSASDLSSSSFTGSSFSGSDSNLSKISNDLPGVPSKKKDGGVKDRNAFGRSMHHQNKLQQSMVMKQHHKSFKSDQGPQSAKSSNSGRISTGPATASSAAKGIGDKRKSEKSVPGGFPATRRRHMSSDSDSESHSGSSFFTGSDSDSDLMSNSDPEFERRRGVKGPPSKRSVGAQGEVREKKAKFDKERISSKSPPISSSKIGESPKTSGIKMTFMKKHTTLRKDVLMTSKLNGGKGSEDEEEVEEVMENQVMREDLDSKLSDKASNPGDSRGEEEQVGSSRDAGRSSNSSRREQLLKQLKAVEDAIARKRAKLH